MQRIATTAAGAALAALLLDAPVLAQSAQPPGLEQRVERLERILDSRTLVQLLDEVELLRREIQELRGQVERQSHTLSQLKDRQRDLYLDLDRRLERVETARAAAGGEPAGSGAAASAAPAGEAPEDSAAAAAPAGEAALAAAATEPDAATAVDPVAEQQAYQDAFNLLKAGRYGEAVEAFTAFLEDYPSGRYGDNAQYWLGEAYYVTRQFEPALTEFRKLVSEYPDSQKMSHGLLKMGYIHHELGRNEEAQRVLSELIERYPNTTAARLARERLQQIRGQTG